MIQYITHFDLGDGRKVDVGMITNNPAEAFEAACDELKSKFDIDPERAIFMCTGGEFIEVGDVQSANSDSTTVINNV